MALAWKDDLLTGQADIDQQHQDIFGKLNAFHEACRSAHGKEMLGDLLAFIERYVHEHFALEERYMMRSNFPDYLIHTASHESFRKACQALRDQLEAQGAGFQVLVATNFFLGGWWREHICTMDKALAAHLRGKV